MIVRIRQCCCALTTFVRLVAVFFLVFHLLLVLSAAIWFTLFSTFTASSNTSALSAAAESGGGDKDLLVLPPSGGEVDDRTFDTFLITGSNRDQQSRQNENQNHGRKLDLLIVIVLGIFATVGILVNVLLMLAIKLEKRTLFFPWFVFHLITVMGKCHVLVQKSYIALRDHPIIMSDFEGVGGQAKSDKGSR